MPLTIPPFSQYQAPLVPLRGLWNAKPPEGDKFVNVEIDWITATGGYQAQQFSLSGNSPVALSQIAALAVDNGRSGADVSFVFPDSGFELVVPAHNQLISPVFTNALMFYAIAPAAIAGDTTILQVLNSIPPPIPIAPSVLQNHASVTGVPLQTNGNTQIIPAGINGTLNAGSITVSASAGATVGQVVLNLIDGKGALVWQTEVTSSANSRNDFVFPLAGLNMRFINGLVLNIGASTMIGDWAVANVYYSTP